MTATTSVLSSWLKLTSKKVVVTGAASGIGAAVTRALVAEGCHVVMADLEDRLDPTRFGAGASSLATMTTTKTAMESSAISGGSVTPIVCDVTQEDQVQELFREATRLGEHAGGGEPCSILVNCAGITRDGWVGKMTLDQWQQVQDVNLTGTFLCCREFLNQKEKDKEEEEAEDSKSTTDRTAKVDSSSSDPRRAIINVASIVGAAQGNLGQANYAASKGGVLGLTRALAKEVAPRGVRVNCVLPGFIDTEMTRAVPAHVQQQIVAKIPMGRFGKPEDVADLILFLTSERSQYITGEGVQCSGMIAM